MKILNLYAGIGGNRKLWGDDHEVVAVESDPAVASIYKDHFPNDTVIIGNAHEYLRLHYKKFDFIWSSPPCQTHSNLRFNIGVKHRGFEPKFPDMTLYEEIIFLMHHAQCYWVVENVNPYYKPLIDSQRRHRHLFWSNFEIPDVALQTIPIRNASIGDLESTYGFDLTQYKIPNKRQALRNCVHPELGKAILGAVEQNHTALVELQPLPTKAKPAI